MDKQVKWELVKYEIRRFAMTYSKIKTQEKRQVLSANECLIKNFETKPQCKHNVSEQEYMNANARLKSIIWKKRRDIY